MDGAAYVRQVERRRLRRVELSPELPHGSVAVRDGRTELSRRVGTRQLPGHVSGLLHRLGQRRQLVGALLRLFRQPAGHVEDATVHGLLHRLYLGFLFLIGELVVVVGHSLEQVRHGEHGVGGLPQLLHGGGLVGRARLRAVALARADRPLIRDDQRVEVLLQLEDRISATRLRGGGGGLGRGGVEDLGAPRNAGVALELAGGELGPGNHCFRLGPSSWTRLIA
ncbi:hypothetical protein SEVIR_7G317901v4 [Setaria viridis]